MGRHKLLLPWGDGTTTIIADVVERARGAVDDVIVVTGDHAGDTAAALSAYDVLIVHNAAHADGEMLSSVKAGVDALPCGCEAFFLVLGDQPGLSQRTFERLIEARRDNPSAMIFSPTWNNRRGHPVLISAGGIDEILKLPPDATLKTFVARHAGAAVEVPVDDAAVVEDIDTPEHYHERTRQRSHSCPSEAAVAAD